jgi:hypothetical protein
LGQWFFSRFDYVLDLRGKRLEFRKQDPNWTRARFRTISGRPPLRAGEWTACCRSVMFKANYVCNSEGYVVFEWPAGR